MAENLDFKVSYVRITEEGLERHNNVYFSEITAEDRKDIKSLTFLPINADNLWDISKMLKDFPILESLYLPSMITTDIKSVEKECPMLKSLVLLSHGTSTNSLDECVVKVNAYEEEGDKTAEFRTFVTTTKEGKQTFLVNSRQVLNREVVVEEKEVSYLTYLQVSQAISGDDGIVKKIEEINAEIEDERLKIDISQETLESLFGLFVEKGVTFEQFTIDFSKMCDKIESYKGIAKSVNQVTIKEDVETSIVETYQKILQNHYAGRIEKLSEIVAKLIKGTSVETENSLMADLTTKVANVVVEHPSFDEDYKEVNTLDTILTEIPSLVAHNIKSSRERGLARKYLSQVVSSLKTNREDLIARIENRLENKVSIEETREKIAEAFGLDLSVRQPAKLVNQIVDVLLPKDFGTLTKADIKGITERIQKEMGNGEIRSREMLEITTRVVADYPTTEEINNVLVDFIEKNSYLAIKLD